MLVACTGVGQYNDWLLYSTASIYNVVDAIVIADGSPFGHFQDRYMNDFEKLDIEAKIKYVEVDWKYPPHPYAEDLGLPIDKDDFSSGRVMKAACDEARRLGCDRILAYAPDHVFDESVKATPKLPLNVDSYRCHYYEMLDFDKVPKVLSPEEYLRKLEDPTFSSCIFLMSQKGSFWGLEGSPAEVSEQKTIRYIWFGHYRDFSPKGWDRTVEYLTERGRYRVHIYNRAGKFDHFLTEKEEEEWIESYVRGYVHTLKNQETWGIGEKLGLPRPIGAVKDSFKYVKDGLS